MVPEEVPGLSCQPKVRCRGEREKRAAFGIGGRGGHVTPKWELQSNFRLTQANLQKAKRLRGKSRRQVAVQQPQVRAGELVDS